VADPAGAANLHNREEAEALAARTTRGPFYTADKAIREFVRRTAMSTYQPPMVGDRTDDPKPLIWTGTAWLPLQPHIRRLKDATLIYLADRSTEGLTRRHAVTKVGEAELAKREAQP
jgi:hypothetical protein